MNILAIETSTKACSAAIFSDGIIYEQFELAPQKHANIILNMIEKCFFMAKIKPQDIDYLAFGEGPGAFTGIRIATGVIQGLALGWNKPVISVSSLESLIWQGYKKTQRVKWSALLDARMKEYYYQTGKIVEGKLLSNKVSLHSTSDNNKIEKNFYLENGIGDIVVEYPRLIRLFSYWQNAYPKASNVCEIAFQRLSTASYISSKLPLPIYLRNNIAKKPKRKIL